ncbi:protein UL87 [Proboscivirus elephantidbeta5]|uniref:Protein UL87 n=1 Tax=Elephant endotheliotropic herpesvirus 5 TaxID=768738 RepID=A0A075CZT8_9BETA|nr:protein UL87 [Elephant endotheliotropic herpesvirus 5]AHC02854.1 protein UL87 [Elephant endotheliotropic herpesvirus 5]
MNLQYTEDTTLIVQTGGNYKYYSVPVCVDSIDLTTEISRSEEKLLTGPGKHVEDPYYIESLFRNLYLNAPGHLKCQEKCFLILKRLLLGPTSVPCAVETWDKTDYMNENPISTENGTLYVYKKCCKCPNNCLFNCTVLTNYGTSHVFRGLLSLQKWETETEPMICFCNRAVPNSEYIAVIFPGEQRITLDMYPYLLNILTRYISICDIDTVTNDLIIELGPNLNHRICIHYKFLFNYAYISKDSFCFIPDMDKEVIIIELNKLVLTVECCTNFFFEKIWQRLNEDYDKYVVLLTLDAAACPSIQNGSMREIKHLAAMLNIALTYGKQKTVKCSLQFQKRFIGFSEEDVIWRNLFSIYFDVSYQRSSDTSSPLRVPVQSSQKYHVLLQRLLKNMKISVSGGGVNIHHGGLVENRFVCSRWEGSAASLYTADMRAGGDIETNEPRESVRMNRIVPDEFNEVVTIRDENFCVNAFNTNRVINVRSINRKHVSTAPSCLTFNFVTDKCIFKEPACTISTFGTSGNTLQSLNINMKGSYVEFIYMLNVYRLHTNTFKFLLPATVCNSNSSLDIHGLVNQEVMRSNRNAVFWTTNFPCMITNINKINMGWFKAATAIVPKVHGDELRTVIRKEIDFLKTSSVVNFDMFLHNLFVELELRNRCQIPLMNKQLVLTLYICLCMSNKCEVSHIQKYLMTLVSQGVFDYSKNMIAHTKVKHVCAIAGSRVCNNVPKILHNKKKVKLDSFGRNANLLTYFGHLNVNELTDKQLSTIVKILIFYVQNIKHKGGFCLLKRIIRKFLNSRVNRKLNGYGCQATTTVDRHRYPT